MVYSVVIPVYNCGEYIVDAINSALAQTIPPRDIIVIDDGSIDDTAQRLRSFEDDKRVVCLRQNNKGVSSARNKAIEYSSSDLIAFLDADDRWHPQKMEKQLPLFAGNVGLVYSLRQCFDDDGFVDSIDKFHLRSDNVAELLLEMNFICTSSAVVLRKSILDVGLFKENLSQGEDRDLWLRIAAAGYGFDFVKEILVYYRMGGAASNLNNIDKRFCDNKLSMTELFAEDSRRQIFSSTVRRRAWAALWRKYA
ncbi:MAG: glycosyltransferase family 2 protein, partial [Thermodesulfobacteriota bacterium]